MSTNDDPLVREARQYTASLVLRPADCDDAQEAGE